MGRVLLAFLLSGLLAFPAWGQTDKELKDWYNDFNASYFGGKLPKDTVIGRFTNKGYLAVTYKGKDGVFVIGFSDSYNLGDIHNELVLLHEMCHIESWHEIAKGTDHGRQWRVCMYKLKAQGAFDNLMIEAY
jgi:hypothetical protein